MVQNGFVIGVLAFFLIMVLVPLVFLLFIRFLDVRQRQHSVLRNFPVLGKVRYILEMIGPEMRQYLFNHDTEGKPFSRVEFLNVVLAGKYMKNIIAFGSKRDFQAPGYYIRNAMFAKQITELRVDQDQLRETQKYVIDKETLFSRKEHAEKLQAKPWLLADEDAVVIGPNCKYPFRVKGLVGMSGMSYGALGEHAITALSNGLGMAGGTWMNTGEGGLSPHHLKGDADIIMQIGPGLFGVRTTDGEIDWEQVKEKAAIPQVKAFELKLAQGAKTRGGHVEGKKVTPEIAKIRGVEPYKTIDSPNRFKEFHDMDSLMRFVEQMKEATQKPVGIKIVVGAPDSVDELAAYMKRTGMGPDFISIDGGEGGTGATYQELADSVGLPIRSALMIADRTLRKYGVRERVKIIASGKLFTPDRVAIALCMGADLIQIARGFMISVGCIGAEKCHTNQCPVGVATTDPKLQKALVIPEKQYRVANYVLALRESLFVLAAAAGLASPTEFSPHHAVYKDDKGRVYTLQELFDIPAMELEQNMEQSEAFTKALKEAN